MKKLIIILVLIPFLCSAQMKIYVVHEKEKADLLVYKTKFFGEADLVIKKTWNILDLDKPFHWYFVSNSQASEADWIIYYTDKMEEANHIVFFTDRKALLGSYSACKPVWTEFERKMLKIK